MVLTLGHLVVGVYLYGEIPLGIDNLGEQRQLVVVSLSNGLTYKGDGLTGDDLVESAAFPGAIGHNGFGTGNGRDRPVLGTPDQGLSVLLEKERGEVHGLEWMVDGGWWIGMEVDSTFHNSLFYYTATSEDTFPDSDPL